ncbi:MAG: LytR/AlgR family response regulator transcription factor [Allosphingosinicella sp.]
MLNIMVVEDEPLFAETLKYLIELNPCYVVTDLADDFASALAAVGRRRPDLALVDLQLARGSSGFSVAAKLGELGILCLFTSGKAPSFPIPDLALGCLVKPFSEEDLVRALKAAEDLLRGRERLRPSRPGNLRLYAQEQEEAVADSVAALPARATVPGTWRARLARWRPSMRGLRSLG